MSYTNVLKGKYDQHLWPDCSHYLVNMSNIFAVHVYESLAVDPHIHMPSTMSYEPKIGTKQVLSSSICLPRRSMKRHCITTNSNLHNM